MADQETAESCTPSQEFLYGKCVETAAAFQPMRQWEISRKDGEKLAEQFLAVILMQWGMG